MATLIQHGNRTEVKLDISLSLKRKVGTLLNRLMKRYEIIGRNKRHEDAFKEVFKSNLYVQIDNEYHHGDSKIGNEVSEKLKVKIHDLLRKLMNSYQVKSDSRAKNFEFVEFFKARMWTILDDTYHRQKVKSHD